MPLELQHYIAVVTTLSLILGAESMRRENMDVSSSESRIKDTLVGNNITGRWDFKVQLVQVRGENRSITDFFLNVFRTNPSGETKIQIDVEVPKDKELWSEDDFQALCSKCGVTGQFERTETQETPDTRRDKAIVEVIVQSTDPNTVIDFVNQISDLSREEIDVSAEGA